MNVLSAADYATTDEMLSLLNLSEDELHTITHALAYSTQLSTDAQHRLWVEEMGAAAPVSPHAQATWYAQQAATIARSQRVFDIIHCHDWMTYYGGIAAKEVARRRGQEVPFIAQIHSAEIDRCGLNGNPAIMAIEKRGLHKADRVVAVSNYTKEVIHRHYDVPRAKISVVHNGIPDREIQRFDFHELKKHHKIVLFMGRLTMQKGPDYFVKLAKSVTDQDPSVRFVLVGSGDMEKRCIEEAARQGLTGKLLFSSFLRGEDVDRAYQLADLFVMPSVSEPFGIVALEAIQNGTPAIVSKQSGVSEVSHNMVKVDFWDIERMTGAVLHLLNDPAYAQQLRQGGLDDLRTLTWNHSAEKMYSVYSALLQQFATHPAYA